MAHVSNGLIFRRSLSEDILVVEARKSGFNVVLLTHLEVFAEVLISAPPVGVDHIETFVSSNLMEVGITKVVLDLVSWQSPITMAHRMRPVCLTDSVPPVLNHLFLLVLYQDPEKEGLVEMEDQNCIHEAETVLIVEWFNLPVSVSEWILEEASDIFEGPPFLRIVSWLFRCVSKFGQVSICGFHQ